MPAHGQEVGREGHYGALIERRAGRSFVVAATKFKADLIVMASHGRKGLDKILLGSETQRVLAHTKLPVLVVR